jgi:hypothetical protein
MHPKSWSKGKFSKICIDFKTLDVFFSSSHLWVRGACESFEMGIGRAFQVKLMDISKCTNLEKRSICAFGTKLGHGLVKDFMVKEPLRQNTQ